MVVPTPTTYAVITGGATSGHVVPALSIIELLVEADHAKENLLYVGSNRGIETTLVPPTGVACMFLSVDGFQRGFSFSNIKRNFKMLPLMMRATQKATQILVQTQPRVVVSVGGYVSAPICRAARRLKIPVVTCSYDSQPGLATKMQARYAAVVAVAQLPSALPHARLSGAPVRGELRTLDIRATRTAARERLAFSPTVKLVVVMGGSLGSSVLNNATQKFVADMNEKLAANVSVLHIAGERFMDSFSLPSVIKRLDGTVQYQRIAYSNQMRDIYGAADVVVSRSGASTVAEIATVGVASILIPWKDAAENHQMTNAKSLSERGGAVLLEESHLTPEVFSQRVCELLQDDTLRLQLAKTAREIGSAHRNCSIAALVESVALVAPRLESK
ncbi:MAG: UDP-N-acetylglucosamine--N-acetylmuramyl-(pentapeptide) pyrophosphoryl-undecaprenol N-acetylglucosamine transferase [Actinobacteria bacterium]|nr:MAG: UDP-N-acetylglucosamine--N-acetylmuramyl-(pentapeptide) pyrophosphoryl-undecaprenol N-acetylglucosamine transferase [Actinomycetota bacterium]